MKRNPVVALLFMMFLITLFFVGCSGIANRYIYDQLPDNIPKGYVEFYEDANTFRWEVWKYQNGTYGKFEKLDNILWRNEGTSLADRLTRQGQRRMIAERPGLHLFQVRLGLAVKEVKVEVIEGMIIPVSVVIDDIKALGTTSSFNREVTEYSFNMFLSIKKHTPFVK
ncbi:MAG: hypothetical protein Q8P24_20300 [Desulfobacterales bacterium]|nr:hypothetical protein [Desulfobacterales bacterium]